jgi:hypothetical protein
MGAKVDVSLLQLFLSGILKPISEWFFKEFIILHGVK